MTGFAGSAPEVQELVLADGRRLELAGLFNLRDVGGYPAADGRTVRWRTLLRSDALHRLDAAGGAVLAGLELRTILDLRTQMEADLAPSALAGLPARLTHISILTGDLQELPLELDAIYRYMIDQCGAAVAAAIKVLGVPDRVIAADYAVSASYLDAEATPAIGQLQASTGLGGELTRPLLSSPPALILDVLARVRKSAGSVEGYLFEHGLRPAELTQLRSALLV